MHFPSRATLFGGLLLTHASHVLAWEGVDPSATASWQGASSGGESVCGCTTYTYTTTGAWVWSPSAAPVDGGDWVGWSSSSSVFAGSASSWPSDPRETPVTSANGGAWGGHTPSFSVSAVPTSSSDLGGPHWSSTGDYSSSQRSWISPGSASSANGIWPSPDSTTVPASTPSVPTSPEKSSSSTSSDPSWQLGVGKNEWTSVYTTTDYVTYDTTDYITYATTIYATVADNFTTTTTQSYTSNYTTVTTYTTTSPTTYTTTTTTTTTTPTTTTTTTTSPTTTTTTTTSPITTTTTTTTSATPSATTCNPGGPQPTFVLLASGSGTTGDGQYALLSNTGDNDIVTFAPTEADGTTFTWDDACDLIGFNGEIANINAGGTQETLFFNTAAQIAGAGYIAATCNVVGGALECVDQTATILYVCSTELQVQIGATVPGGCAAVTLTPVYQ